VLSQCHITSQSGRGVVVMDGGRVAMQRCSVVNCAATGVYIGGSPPSAAAAPAAPPEPRRSRADLKDSRVSGNGIGGYYREALALLPTGGAGGGGARGLLRNRIPRRTPVIARGHSGVYLEQGDCHIATSVIRSNVLTGISAVGDQARLVVTGSTLASNGAQQLETVPSRHVRLENNRIVDHPPAPPPRQGAPLWAQGGRDQNMEEFVRMVMDQP
jgi:hypothetical protein